MSLCYYCGSTEVAQKGALFVGAGIEPENEKKAAEAILYQLDEMKKGNISDGELSDAKLALMDSVNRIADSAGAILNWHFSGVMNGTLLTPEEKKAKIASVTREDVVRLAENIRLDTYYFLSGKEKA
jgi:predicted Zn-dependent peptidase